jgi:flagellar hook protein FlgE
MFTAFSTALSGLNAMTNAIDVVGNNLANLNTTGYKDASVSFSEIISEALGGTASAQVGLGVATPSASNNFIQGAIQTTGGKYDEAIQGDGFFVDKTTGGQTEYTRDGSFNVDANGYLVTSGGQRVQGWTGISNGAINTNAAIGDIQVPTGTLSQPVATTTFSLSANLDSSYTPILPMAQTGSTSGAIALTTANNTLNLGINGVAAQPFTLLTTDTSMTAVAADLNNQFATAVPPITGVTASVNSSGNLLISSTSSAAAAGVQVYNGTGNSPLGLSITSTATSSLNTFSSGEVQAVDSLGNSVPLTLSFTKDTTNGTWSYSVSSTEGTVAGGQGTVQFNNAGVMTSINSPTISSDGRSDNLTISNMPDGAANLSMAWNFFSPTGTPNFTQYSETSAASANTQNGLPASELTSVSLGSGGQVVAQFANGPQQIVGQLALATVRNPTSLLGTSDNNFTLGSASAIPTIGTTATGGRGTLEGGALESSTVDIASEFSNLLTYERSYQANSRVITVSDDISQETVNLIK